MKHTPRPASVYHLLCPVGTPTKLLSPSPDRRSVLFSVGGGTIMVSNKPTAQYLGAFKISEDLPPLQICACHQGQFVCGEFWGVALGEDLIIFIIEGFEDVWPLNPPWLS